MKKYIATILLSLAAIACTKDNERLNLPELGVKQDAYVLDCAPGEFYIDVLSDGEFTASVSDADWMKFKNNASKEYAGANDERLYVLYDFNRGTERQSKISITRGNKKIEISVFQNGVIPSGIQFACRSLEVSEDGGRQSVSVISVYNMEDLDIRVEYNGDGGWISDVSKENSSLLFDCLGNAGADNRSAVISLSHRGDSSVEGKLQVVQYGNGAYPAEKSISEIKGLLQESGELVITENLMVNGIVCGDDEEGNGGENANVSSIIQDLTLSARTAYIENSDASSGMKLVFSEEGNITKRYDKVKLLLKDTKLVRKGNGTDDPVRYEISGLKSSNILSAVNGSEYEMPVKEKFISELCDDDLYTFVTLKECEIPVRKGPFAPIDIRLTSVMHSYPMIVRDVNGNNIHLMTNLSASWQRDGKTMPQGSGKISGVIVHETCDNFEWDTEEMHRQIQEGSSADYVTGIGNIGAYQIRPFRRSDIKLAEDFNDGFSGLLMEIRYYNKDNDEIIKNVNGNTVFSTYPPVKDPLTNTEIRGTFSVMEGNPGKQAGIAVWRDWTHLGPMEGGVITDASRGNGVYDADGNPVEWAPSSSVTTTGLLLNASGWYAGSNWGPSKYWMASFRTTATASAPALTAANFPISVQFGAVSGLGQNVGAPRYWCIEYRTSSEGEWIEVGKYTVPDFPILSNRKPWQCPGPKYVSVTLPEDGNLLNNDNVFVRLRPVSNVAGSSDNYDESTVVNGRQTELNYFAIRFNK